jgi:hypothetical protein
MPIQSPAPTEAQRQWLNKNKGYTRMSHVGHLAKFSARGTLYPDGTFTPETPRTPLTDGNGAFSVGKMIVSRRRR